MALYDTTDKLQDSGQTCAYRAQDF